MFKKILTTTHHNGVTTEDVVETVGPDHVEADIAAEIRNLRPMTRTYGRIAHVEKTMTTLVIVYTSGTVEIFRWVAE